MSDPVVPLLLGPDRHPLARWLSPLSLCRGGVSTARLTDADRTEVLRFLPARSAPAVIMSGLIHDHGLEGPEVRGSFYGVRSDGENLEAVALIGQTSIFEARSKRALRAVAEQARQCSGVHLLFGEEEQIELFWRYFTHNDRPLSPCARRELLYELTRGAANFGAGAAGLRLAAPVDLEQVAAAHAALLSGEEWVADARPIDWGSFRERCARRIAANRVWVVTEGDELIFKADVVTRTPDTAYLEGIYVAPPWRGRGFGFRCLAALHRVLLSEVENVCLLVGDGNLPARRLYDKCGYHLRGCYGALSL